MTLYSYACIMFSMCIIGLLPLLDHPRRQVPELVFNLPRTRGSCSDLGFPRGMVRLHGTVRPPGFVGDQLFIGRLQQLCVGLVAAQDTVGLCMDSVQIRVLRSAGGSATGSGSGRLGLAAVGWVHRT